MIPAAISALLPLALGVHPAPAQGVDDLDRYVLEELDVARYELQVLPLSAAEGRPVELQLVLDGQRVTLDLTPYSVRVEDFELRVQRADGSIVSVPAPPQATYRGAIAGQPLSRVAAGRIAEGWKALVVAADGRAWYVQPLDEVVPGSAPGVHLVYRHDDVVLPPNFCGTGALPLPPPDAGHDPAAGGCLKIAELAWDCDYETYLANGASVANTIADVDAVTNALNVYYARDVLIEHQITNVLVRTAEPDPYVSYDPGVLLDTFVNEWRNNQTGIQRDMAHLATGREMDGNIIGLAYVGVTCNSAWAYGLTQWNLGFGGHVSVAAHELGHNWNAPHCADACDIMCGGCPYFGPNTTAIIMAYRNAVGCLDDGPPFSDPLPPHVLPEILEITGEVVVDVLANDFDGNCDPLTIASFDAVSQQGGRSRAGRSRAATTRAPARVQGQTPSSTASPTGPGTSSTGRSRSPELPVIAAHCARRAHGHDDDRFVWSGRRNLFGPSPTGGARDCYPSASGGVDAEVLSGSPLRLRKELSIAVWNPTQVSGQNQIFGNGSSWVFGIRDGDLYFTLAGVKDFTLPSNIPPFAWTHVAAVFDTGLDVTLYVNGSSLGSLGGNAQGGLPGDKWFMAGAGGLSDIYAGRIDDLQVYDYSLTPDSARALTSRARAAGPARRPDIKTPWAPPDLEAAHQHLAERLSPFRLPARSVRHLLRRTRSSCRSATLSCVGGASPYPCR
jgi:hypothetical protein